MIEFEPPSSEQDPNVPSAGIPSDTQLLKLSVDAYTSSTTYFNANIRNEIQNDIRQWQSLHPMGSKYYSATYAGKSRLFRPKTRAFVRKAEAKAAEAFFSNFDILSIKPDDPDDKIAMKGADFYKALLQKRLTMPVEKGGIPWYLTCLGAYQESMVTGICISMQDWEFDPRQNIDRPSVALLPIENFRFDPAADWRNPTLSSPYLIGLFPKYIGDIKDEIAQGKCRPVSDSVLMNGAKAYADSIRLQRENNRIDNTQSRHEHNDFDICWVHLYVVRIDGQDWVWRTIGTETVLSDPVPLAQRFPHGRPFRIGFSTIEAHRNYPSGDTRLSRDVQREANELANSRIDNVHFVLNKRYFVKRDRQVDLASIVRNVAGSVTLLQDPEKDVRVVDTSDVTSSSYQEQDRLNLDFDDVVGGMAQSSVASNRKLNETVGGMNILQINQNIVDAYRLHTFIETWVEPVLQQLIEVEKNFEDDFRFVSMAAKAAGFDEDPEEFGDWVWDLDVLLNVNVAMQAANPQDRVNSVMFAFNSLRNLLGDNILEQRGMDVREVAKEIFATVGFRDGSRFFNWQQEDPTILSLRAQIQNLQQELEAKMPQRLLEAEVEKRAADTVLKYIQAFYSAMQSGQVVATVPSVAPMADAMLEASGFRPKPGVDPNLPAPAAPDPALAQGPVFNGRTGVGFTPGNTHPNLPASADAGAARGIETPAADGAR